MNKTEKIINQNILEILEGKEYLCDFTESSKLIEDLGFSSLDLAELVAGLELELGFDPFSKNLSVSTIKSVKDLYLAYSD